MKYRRLGTAGIRLSEVGLGSWLTYSQGVHEDQAAACIRTAYETGINFFDTADVYNSGGAEEVYGCVLKEFPRERLVIATKCYFPMSDDPNDRGLSRKHIFESIHRSLRRLQTDYVDLYQCHRFDAETPLEETVRAMSDLIRQGKILYWGTSMWPEARIRQACEMADRVGEYRPQSEQPCYNLALRRIEANGVLEACAERGIGVIVFSPLAQGVLTGKYSGGKIPPNSRAANYRMNEFIKNRIEADILQRVDNLRPWARQLGTSLASFALAWILRRPEVTSAIIGATKPEQIRENATACDVSIPEDVLAEVDKIFPVTP